MPRLAFGFELPHPCEEVFAWHGRAGALERLIPPWESVRVIERTGGLEEGARVTLQVRGWAGLVGGPGGFEWEVEHTGFDPGRRFVDEQRRGPFARWRHEHRFEPLGPVRTAVEDVVEWEAPLGSVGEALTESVVRRALTRLFAFRARRLAGDLAAHARHGPGDGRIVAITGITGLVGSALAAFLRAGGYRVLGISRSGSSGEDTIPWDPARGRLDPGALEGVHAVVHLAGASITGIRWTAAHKDAILRSREEGTRLLARTLAAMDRPPEVLISASGVHYYGDRGDERLTEASDPGTGFLADVCRRWEDATQPARAAGIRTVRLRIGPVLSPAGGMLGTMLLPFRMGLGGRIGSGRAYLSWIDLDDLTGLILHAIRTPALRGPVNATAPAPVTNAAFADILGRVLGRPTLIPVPAFAVRAALGEMGRELLLTGQRALPERALESGYPFLRSDLEDALRHQLGADEEAAIPTEIS